MKKALFGVFAGMLLLLGVGIGHGFSQDMGDEPPPPDKKCGGEEDPWAKLQTPGEQHEWLSRSAGDWNIEAKMWMEGAEEPIEMKGTSTVKMLWGRYMYEEFTLGEGDMKFEGRGYIGYDNSNEQFCATYFGNNGTALRVFTGKRVGDDKLILTGEWVEKGMGDMPVKERVETVEKDDNTSVVTMYAKYGDAPETKLMEMTYTRKK